MASVMVIVGPNKGELYPFGEGEVVALGRDPAGRVQLTDERASRHHARIEHDPQTKYWRLVDLGSANGTTLNGVRIDAPTFLKDGDTIGVGQTLLRFSARSLAHDAKDYAALQHIPAPRERFRETQMEQPKKGPPLR